VVGRPAVGEDVDDREIADVLDVARVEGASPLQVLRYVLLPLSVPALAAVGLFAVAVVFNDYLYTFTLVSDPSSMTLMADVGSNLVDIDDPGPTFAEIMLGVAPVALLCAFFADTYARGFSTGVVK
jgi:ABC-type glycerol-3-phosphate transport system permease component